MTMKNNLLAEFHAENVRTADREILMLASMLLIGTLPPNDVGMDIFRGALTHSLKDTWLLPALNDSKAAIALKKPVTQLAMAKDRLATYAALAGMFLMESGGLKGIERTIDHSTALLDKLAAEHAGETVTADAEANDDEVSVRVIKIDMNDPDSLDKLPEDVPQEVRDFLHKLRASKTEDKPSIQ